MSVVYATSIAVATASYPATPQFAPTNGGKLLLQHPGTVNNLITFSYDGTNDAGFLLPGTWVATDSKAVQLYLKGAAATSTTIYVSAETV